MALTLLGLALVNSCLFAGDFVYEYAHQKNHFYAILAAMYRSARVRAFVAVQSVLLVYCAYRLITWLLFGPLSRTELNYLKDVRWPLFAELANTYLIFQGAVTGEFWPFLHFMTMYYILMTTLLLDKRIDEVANQEADDDLNQRARQDTGPQHNGIMLTIAVLVAVNWLGLRYQFSQLHDPKTAKVSLQVLVTVHRYVISSALLAKATVNYVLELIESRHQDREQQQEEESSNMSLYKSAMSLLVETLTAASYCTVMFFMLAYETRAITLLRMTVRAVQRCYRSLKALVESLQALLRLATFPTPTSAAVVRAQSCAICLDSMASNEDALQELRCLPVCGHVFHQRCLKRWASERPVCPSCRSPL